MEELDILLQSARTGHIDAREKIIQRFRPLIIKTASSLSGKYIDAARDDEISIGMLAINHAIDTFDPQGGAAFFSYAELLIKRRLIDYYRRESRQQKAIPFSSLEGEETEERGILNQLEHRQSLSELQKLREQNERREEIRKYTERLKDYGIKFSDLVAVSPKHQDARIRAMEVAKIVAGDPVLLSDLENKKVLPLKQIEKRVAVSRKTLDRQRKYIIAVTVIMTGEYHYLREYLHNVL